MKQYHLKIGALGSAIVNRYYDIEYTVVHAYKAMEHCVVDRYNKIEAAFAATFLEETDRS